VISEKRVAIIGAGQMGEALLRGFLKSGILSPGQIILSDIRIDRLSVLKAKYQVEVAKDNIDALEKSDVVILAVKPQQIDGVLAEISWVIKEKQILISTAAGISTKHIYDKLGKKIPLVRVMPNSPALVGAGISVISPGRYATRESIDLVSMLFSGVGETLQLDERYQNEATAISGSGPAYFYLFVEALIDAGVRSGLAPEIATKLVVETLIGAGAMLKQTKKHPALLREMVASPGGTTIAALEAFEEGGLRAATFKAIEAAIKRAQELGGLKAGSSHSVH